MARVEQLSDMPFHIFAACAKDGYRKPMPGMWYELERIFKEQHVDIGMYVYNVRRSSEDVMLRHRQEGSVLCR